MTNYSGIEYLLRDGDSWWHKRSLSRGPDVAWVEAGSDGTTERVAEPSNFTNPWSVPTLDNPIVSRSVIAALRSTTLDNPSMLDQIKSEEMKSAYLDGSILSDEWIERLERESAAKRFAPLDQLKEKWLDKLVDPALFTIKDEVILGSRETSLAGRRAILLATVLPNFEGIYAKTETTEWSALSVDDLDRITKSLNPNSPSVAIAQLMIALSGVDSPNKE